MELSTTLTGLESYDKKGKIKALMQLRSGVGTKWESHTYKMVATCVQNGTCILTKWQLHTYKMASAYLQNDSYTLTKWHLQTYKMAAM